MNIESWIVLMSVVASISGLAFGIYNYLRVAKIKMRKRRPESPKKRTDTLTGSEKVDRSDRTLAEADYDKLVKAGELISSSALVYLMQEYVILAAFVGSFGLLIYVSWRADH